MSWLKARRNRELGRFLGLGHLVAEAEAISESHDPQWTHHRGVMVETDKGTMFLVFPEFVESTVYLEVANTLASRLSGTGEITAPRALSRDDLRGALAGVTLEPWTHRFLGNVVRFWVGLR